VPSFLKRGLAKAAAADLSPVCAIVGGILGQQIIKVVTAKDEPFKNFFFYNAMMASGVVEDIKATP
jgi:ubiquitin-like 1-activating enzyme E1 A